MTEEQEMAFNEWWNECGSGITLLPHEDQEGHAKRVAFRAYCACLEDNDLDT